MPALTRLRRLAPWVVLFLFAAVAYVAIRARGPRPPTLHEQRAAMFEQLNRACPQPSDHEFVLRGVGLDERFTPEFIFYFEIPNSRFPLGAPDGMADELHTAALERARGQTTMAEMCRALGVNIRYTYSFKSGRLITSFVLTAAEYAVPVPTPSTPAPPTPQLPRNPAGGQVTSLPPHYLPPQSPVAGAA